MTTFTSKNKHPAPATRKSRSSRFGYRGPQVKAQQSMVRRILRFSGSPRLNPSRAPSQIQRRISGTASNIGLLAAAGSQITQPQAFRQGVLSLAKAKRAARFNNKRYDPKSLIIIENILNQTTDGHCSLNDAQAIATYQQNSSGLGKTGMVGENTLNVMLPYLVGKRMHSQAINLVTDYYNFDLSDVLSVGYEANVLGTKTDFESGYLRVIRIGKQAFSKATALRNAIAQAMSIPTPGHMEVSLTQRLNPKQVRDAISANNKRFQDLRSILTIQTLVQAPATGVIDADTSQYIAQFQHNRGLMQPPDGKIDSQNTLQTMILELAGSRYYNSAIRMLIDYYNMRTHGTLLDIAVSQQSAPLAGWVPGTTALRINESWFRRSFPALVNHIINMLDLVRTRKAGIEHRCVRIFLSEVAEIVGKKALKEPFHDFMLDINRALVFWKRMTLQEQRKYWKEFCLIRAKFHKRFSVANFAQQQAASQIRQEYDSMSRP